jgi:hypothetical protein
MEFTTIEEALNAQVRCETCGRPKKTTEAVYFNGGVGAYYRLVDCLVSDCQLHCSGTHAE